ncbi:MULTISPECIES: flavodoxin family protein [Clostridium]|uniref:flavodoxin family protein n=1 Tax=Clostridium TaxID=1485 RepID=UPI00069D4AF0|nr:MULTISPECIES: NAD(P)H-dependent oxidoreductase [Clostridium]KOF56399.1 NADPH-dependent FMN reductase [Clostridium sp. DMHC 10]MCD2345854.1 NAD(P)H-dependent oxidoreductase [Clostridium guangxiense]
MKILIINGGPRRGNTWKLTMLVKEYLLLMSSEIEFTELHLKDLNLPFCTGCSSCFRKGHIYCPHNSIVQKIMDKIEESDGVIFSAPTYNLQMPALTKNFVDHLCFMFHRPRYFNKKGLVISTTGGVGAGNSTKNMAGTMKGWGFNYCYTLPISSVSWNNYEPTEKHKRKAEAAARKFYEDTASKKLHAPSYPILIPYNLFRGMSFDYVKGSEYATQDGVFWQEGNRLKKAYDAAVPLSIFKRIFGNMFYLLGRIMSKHMIVTYKK